MNSRFPIVILNGTSFFFISLVQGKLNMLSGHIICIIRIPEGIEIKKVTEQIVPNIGGTK